MDHIGQSDQAETELLATLPEPQRLALGYASAQARPATLTLFALDSRLAAAVRGAREPLAAQLRLAWWRDVLARPRAEWPQGEPLLAALRAWQSPALLGELVDGWEQLLSETLTDAAIEQFAAGRGHAFRALSGELGLTATAPAAAAGRLWALADLAAHLSDRDERAHVVALGKGLEQPRLPGQLRPLRVLAGLGRAALDRGGTPLLRGPVDVARALRIGLAGR
jgi:phytoene synthase